MSGSHDTVRISYLRLAGVLSVASVAISCVIGCGGRIQTEGYRAAGEGARPEVGSGALTVMWTAALTSQFPGRFIPVEFATAALNLDEGTVWVGSSEGSLWAFRLNGTRIFRYQAGSSIEAAPAIESQPGGRIYLATAGGTLDAINAGDGKRLWRVALDAPVRRQPLLSRDAIYIVTAANSVIAVARTNGEVLWRYHRDIPEGFSITGNAGLLVLEGKLLTGFSDGVVVALDASDGRVVWERDTALDLEDTETDQNRVTDVDTTPTRVGKDVYVASVTAGLYALSPSDGTISWRNSELKAITAIAAEGRKVILSSAEKGVLCIDSETHEILWQHPVKRGSPGQVQISGDLVFIGESEGGFLALSLKTGRELARLESGHGFSAAASVGRGRGFLLSNGGTLFAFSY